MRVAACPQSSRVTFTADCSLKPGYPNLSQSIPIYPNLSQSIPIYPNLSQSIPIYPNLSQSIPIYPNLSQSIPIYPNLSQSIPIYPNLSQSIPIYPNLSQSIPIYPNLSQSIGHPPLYKRPGTSCRNCPRGSSNSDVRQSRKSRSDRKFLRKSSACASSRSISSLGVGASGSGAAAGDRGEFGGRMASRLWDRRANFAVTAVFFQRACARCCCFRRRWRQKSSSQTGHRLVTIHSSSPAAQTQLLEIFSKCFENLGNFVFKSQKGWDRSPGFVIHFAVLTPKFGPVREANAQGEIHRIPIPGTPARRSQRPSTWGLRVRENIQERRAVDSGRGGGARTVALQGAPKPNRTRAMPSL